MKRMSILLILLVLAMSLAIPASLARADGDNKVGFTAEAYSGCWSGEVVDFCSLGDSYAKPNGETVIVGVKDTMIFVATDDRWNVNCRFSSDPYTLGKPNAWTWNGSFVCYPRNQKYAGGYWAGRVNQVIQNDKYVGAWSAKGYGTFDRLQASSYNSMTKNYLDVPPGTTDVGVIIELPGYVPVK
jgi:hypothetical protein